MDFQTIKIEQKDAQKRFDVFLVDFFNKKYPRAKLTQAIEKELILINNKKQKTSYKLKINDEININLKDLNTFLNPNETLNAWDFKLDIIYEDEFLAVINKPKEMLTHPTKYDKEKTLCNALIAKYGQNLSNIDPTRPAIVHRLDKNTSGLIVIAKDNETHLNLQEQIKEKICKRKYKAIALVDFIEDSGIIDKPLAHYLKENVKMTIAKDGEGLSAITHYKVLEKFKGASLIELELKTGRTHQIRVHLASIGHPIFGDSLYGAKSFMRNEFYNLKTTEQLLQSYFISFIHPKTNETMKFKLEEEKYSKDFIKVLNFLRSKNGKY